VPSTEPLEERQSKLLKLLECQRAALREPKFEDAARLIFDTCKDVVGAAAGYVAMLSDDGTENEVLHLDPGDVPCAVDPDTPMPIRELRAEAIRTGAPVWDNDFSDSEWSALLPEGHARVANVLFAPLLLDGKLVGLLELANKPDGFTDEDAWLAGASSCAMSGRCPR